jgi:hypothetical protein
MWMAACCRGVPSAATWRLFLALVPSIVGPSVPNEGNRVCKKGGGFPWIPWSFRRWFGWAHWPPGFWGP